MEMVEDRTDDMLFHAAYLFVVSGRMFSWKLAMENDMYDASYAYTHHMQWAPIAGLLPNTCWNWA